VSDGVGHAKRIADLFAGLGTFTLALAGNAAVDAFEADETALAALAEAAPPYAEAEACAGRLPRPLPDAAWTRGARSL
jgi:predicted RNA methylase